MDNNFKQPSGHKSSGLSPRARNSVDGFVTPESFAGSGSISFSTQPKKVEDGSAKKLDDFSRPDGFHSSSQPISGSDPVPMATPTFGDDAAPLAKPVQVVPNLPAPLLDTGPRRRSLLHKKNRGLSRGIKPGRRWARYLKRTGLALGVLILVAGVYFGIKIYGVQKHLFRGGGSAPALAQTIDISKLNGEGDGRVNILLLGIGGPGHDGPDLTDTIMLLSIDPTNNQAAMLSIPRDLWVQIPGYGSQKINAAFAYGKQNSKAKDYAGKTRDGLSLIDQTLKPVIGVPIHYHVVVNFTAFKQAVDAVGGVTFNVPDQLYDPTIAWENHGKALIAPTGMQTFDGARALLYARSRETSTDFARGQRQRQLLVALKDKILSAGTYSNPLKVSQLLSSFGNNVYTDFNTTDISRVYQIASQIPSSSIVSLDLVTPPHAYLTTAPINGLSTVVPKAGLNVYDDIEAYVRNALRDGFLQQENASLTILNGTSQIGLASTKSKELKSYGYNVTTVADAPTSNYQKTLLIDMTKGVKKYTKNYLEKRLGVTATTTLPAGVTATGADFVIILGSDASTTSNSTTSQ